MATKKKQVENPQELENFENAVLTTEAFIEKNQKQLMVAFVAILVVLTAWLAYRNLYQIPTNQEAELLVYTGQDYFNSAKYDIALNGDSVDFVGFVAIADEYGNTPSGELACAYAGLSYYKLGDYDKAIEYLSDYSSSDAILGYSIVGTLGDCYAQKGDVEAALPFLEEATGSDNIMIAATYSLKVARAYEFLGETDKALEMYKFIEKEYKGVMPGMTDVDDVQKFINALSK